MRYGKTERRDQISNRTTDATDCRRATHPELVGPELVDVWALAGHRLVPEGEL